MPASPRAELLSLPPSVGLSRPACNAPVRPDDRSSQSCGWALPASASSTAWTSFLQSRAAAPGSVACAKLIGCCLASALGGIALLHGDLAGWEELRYVGPGAYSYRGTTTGPGTQPESFLIIALLAPMLLSTAWVCLRELTTGGQRVVPSGLVTEFRTAICAAAGTLVAGLALLVAMVSAEPVGWWLD